MGRRIAGPDRRGDDVGLCRLDCRRRRQSIEHVRRERTLSSDKTGWSKRVLPSRLLPGISLAVTTAATPEERRAALKSTNEIRCQLTNQ